MWKFDIFGVIIHLMLIIWICDVYKEYVFTSDVNNQNRPIADRVVVFVLSGLRPDMVYTSVNELKHIPLWDKFKVHGILKSEVPSTSKNGFIAFTTGINEGLLTVVPAYRTLDTIFDRVKNTVYFGPDNYDSFYLKKKLWTHINYNIDLNNLKYNINDETLTNVQLSANEIKRNKLIIIHLKQLIQYSKSYDCLYKCIDIVVNQFNQINNIYKFIENKFVNTTVYILMADHGMTSAGNYGGNTIEEIETFFALWGKNIKTGKFKLNQTQIANIISTVLGVEIPKNSLAITPVDLFLTNETDRQFYKALNALHLASIALKSIEQLELFVKLLNYIKFEPFEGYKRMLEYNTIIQKRIKLNDLNTTDLLSDELITLSLKGIDAIKKTMSFMLIFLVNITYIGWIILLTLILININYNKSIETNKDGLDEEEIKKAHRVRFCVTLNTFFIITGILAFIFVISHNWPLQYFLYWLLPMLIWHRIMYALAIVVNYSKTMFTMKTFPKLFLNISICLIASEILVWGMQYRMILFLAIILITIYLTVRCMLCNCCTTGILLLSIVTSGLSLALSIAVPYNAQLYNTNPFLLNISALIWIICGIILSFKMRFTFFDFLITLLAIVHHLCSLILVNITFIKSDANEYKVAYIQLISSVFIPLFGGTFIQNRLTQLAICLSSVFLLFSLNHELLVFFILFILLSCWYFIENSSENKSFNTSIDLPLIFITLVLSSYYIMGNVDDINFINVKFTKRFIDEQSNPIYNIGLLLIKHCIVLYLLQAMFSVILRTRKDQAKSLYLISVLLLNIIGYRSIIQLIFWPDLNEISKLLTKHCLIQINTAFLMATYSLVQILISFSIWTRCNRLKEIIKKQFVKKKL